MPRIARLSGARMPDFLAVGPPRTATTWLEYMIEGHVTLPRGIKETDFFGGNFDLGTDWYLSHFADCSPGRPVGEICPTYFDSALARERIAASVPKCRIICTLRDPVARIYSHYRLLRHEGLAAEPFERVLERHRRASGAGTLLVSSRYATHLEQWHRMFGERNVLVLIHDDLEADPQAFLGRVCELLEIAPISIEQAPDAGGRVNRIERAPRSRHLAKSARRLKMHLIRQRHYRTLAALQPLWDFCAGGGAPFPTLNPELEIILREELLPEIVRLEKMLGRGLGAWKQPTELRCKAP
ncbi:MAG TPA: sulfotransferase [Candidatus Binataceae bacterium]|nr:sulfotransferase [Candidatus Binataceae bacterium]